MMKGESSHLSIKGVILFRDSGLIFFRNLPISLLSPRISKLRKWMAKKGTLNIVKAFDLQMVIHLTLDGDGRFIWNIHIFFK